MTDHETLQRITLIGPCPVGLLVGRLHASDQAAARALHTPMAGVVAELASMLVDNGHTVQVITTSNDVNDVREFTGPNLVLQLVPLRRPRHFLSDLYREERRQIVDLVTAFRPNILHPHWTYEAQLAAHDIARSTTTVVTTAQDAPLTILRHEHNAFFAARAIVALRARPTITHLSTPSPYLASIWRRDMAYRKPIAVIPNTIPLDIGDEPRRPAPSPVIVDVTGPDRRKNVAGLLAAFAVTRRQVPEAELRLIGHGLTESGEIARRAGEEGWAEGVRFLGPLERRHVVTEVRNAWLFAHASREESFGISVIEALAVGTPVIAGNRSGAIPWVLGEGQLGTLTDVTDANAFGSDLARLIHGGPLSTPEGSVEQVQRRFSAKAVYPQWIQWYRQCQRAVR